MRCVWQGNLHRTWDVLKLLRILENLKYWITSHYRPWVSNCIDSWVFAVENTASVNDDIVHMGQFDDLLPPEDDEQDSDGNTDVESETSSEESVEDTSDYDDDETSSSSSEGEDDSSTDKD